MPGKKRSHSQAAGGGASSRSGNSRQSVKRARVGARGKYEGRFKGEVFLDGTHEQPDLALAAMREAEDHISRHGDIALVLVCDGSADKLPKTGYGGYGLIFRRLAPGTSSDGVIVKQAWSLHPAVDCNLLEAIGVLQSLWQANEEIRKAIDEQRLVLPGSSGQPGALNTCGNPIKVIIGTDSKTTLEALKDEALCLDPPQALFAPSLPPTTCSPSARSTTCGAFGPPVQPNLAAPFPPSYSSAQSIQQAPPFSTFGAPGTVAPPAPFIFGTAGTFCPPGLPTSSLPSAPFPSPPVKGKCQTLVTTSSSGSTPVPTATKTNKELWEEVIELAIRASQDLNNLPNGFEVDLELRWAPAHRLGYTDNIKMKFHPEADRLATTARRSRRHFHKVGRFITPFAPSVIRFIKDCPIVVESAPEIPSSVFVVQAMPIEADDEAVNEARKELAEREAMLLSGQKELESSREALHTLTEATEAKKMELDGKMKELETRGDVALKETAAAHAQTEAAHAQTEAALARVTAARAEIDAAYVQRAADMEEANRDRAAEQLLREDRACREIVIEQERIALEKSRWIGIAGVVVAAVVSAGVKFVSS